MIANAGLGVCRAQRAARVSTAARITSVTGRLARRLSLSLASSLLVACSTLEPIAPPQVANPGPVSPPPTVIETPSADPAEPKAAAETAKRQPRPASAPQAQNKPKRPPRTGGAYFENDGPGDNPPANIDTIPDATPRPEALASRANRPYTLYGRQYQPEREIKPFRQRGVASWYGRKFHGNKTAIGERYDMYAMTAAHPTLPLPSYARVTNIKTGQSIVVRVNDRGPFLKNRVIDLSYTAAHKLGYLHTGFTEVEVEQIAPDSGANRGGKPAAQPSAANNAAESLGLPEANDANIAWATQNRGLSSQRTPVLLQLGAIQ